MSRHDSTVDWQDGQPVSSRYGDVYFSRNSGLDETRYVFLHHNHLAPRWRDLPAGAQFVIAETGFGTGLNFLCAWQLWEECAPQDARLHFVSIEKHPLSVPDMVRALALWPSLARWREAFLAQYHDLSPGWHRFVFGERVRLTLAVGDVAEVLPQLAGRADAWFLDGFAPARNPAMWQSEVLEQVARLSNIGGTFATFTAAGAVRRGLEAAGFAVERVPGYAGKREMLRGRLAAAPDERRAARSTVHADRRAIVIGGGLAGTSAAANLAARGWEVTLLERHDSLASETSGNPLGILYPRLAAAATPLRELILAGYQYSLRRIPQLLPNGIDAQTCGLLQLAFDEAEAQRQHKLLAQGFPAQLFRGVDRMEASALAGIELPQGGLYFPAGGWVRPAALCHALAAHPGISVRLATEALSMRRVNDSWEVNGAGGCIARAPVLVLAAAGDTARFDATRQLPLRTIRGQLTLLPVTAASAVLRTIVCGKGYVSPALDGSHVVGATHKFHDPSTALRATEHEENFEMLRTLAPALHAALDLEQQDPASLSGRAGVRLSTSDYLPLIGAVPAMDASEAADAGAINLESESIATLPGLYLSTAHGSRGLITAPLAGEMLAAQIEGEPAPVSRAVLEATDPARFLRRARRRAPRTQRSA